MASCCVFGVGARADAVPLMMGNSERQPAGDYAYGPNTLP